MKPKRITARERELLAELLYAGRRLRAAADWERGGDFKFCTSLLKSSDHCLDIVQEALGEPRGWSDDDSDEVGE